MPQPDGMTYFYSTVLPSFSCGHPESYEISINRYSAKMCGLCFLKLAFESEVPKRIHEYEQLNESGNPAFHGLFLAHLEGQFGLKGPKEGENLRDFRLARGQLRRPSKGQLPITYALWKMFGEQPKMARPLLKSLLGGTEEEVSQELGLSLYMLRSTLGKAVRLALRNAR